MKLADASARLPYEFLPELQPLYSSRLWRTVPELQTSDQWKFVKDLAKYKNKKDIDFVCRGHIE